MLVFQQQLELTYIASVRLQVYAGDGAGWKTVLITNFSASGGTVTTDGIYTVHTFTTTGTGTFNFTMEGSKTIDYLVLLVVEATLVHHREQIVNQDQERVVY